MVRRGWGRLPLNGCRLRRRQPLPAQPFDSLVGIERKTAIGSRMLRRPTRNRSLMLVAPASWRWRRASEERARFAGFAAAQPRGDVFLGPNTLLNAV